MNRRHETFGTSLKYDQNLHPNEPSVRLPEKAYWGFSLVGNDGSSELRNFRRQIIVLKQSDARRVLNASQLS